MFKTIITAAAIVLSLSSVASAGEWSQDHCKADLQLGYVSVHQNKTAHNIANHCSTHLHGSDPIPFGKHKGQAWEEVYSGASHQWATYTYIPTTSWSAIANTPNQ